MTSKPLCISNNELKILGIWDQPENFDEYSIKKICLICIGLNGNRVEKNRMLIKLSRVLTSYGISVIRFEYSGLGVSEGDFWDSSIQTKVADTLQVIRTINEMNDDCLEWNLLSYSDGISIILNMLDKENIIFNKLIAWSPILFPITSDVKDPMRFVREQRTKKLVLPFGGLWLGKEYLRDISRDNNLLDKLMNYFDKTHCIWGLKDSKVKETIEALQAINSIEKKYIQEADHEFSSKKWLDIVIKQTINWLTERKNENEPY